MPYASVNELRQSRLWGALDELHGMSTSKLEKFIATFNAVHARVTRQGGGDAQAESMGIAIALSAARSAPSASLDSVLETETHYFAAMMPQQLGTSNGVTAGHEFSFDFVRQNPDLASAIAAGVAFNWDHTGVHQLGVIDGIQMPDKVPETIRAAADKDTPFFFLARYRKDVPPEARAEAGISAEWLPLVYASGVKDAIPITFAVSHVPLNGVETGIRRIAALQVPDLKPSDASDSEKAEKDYKEDLTADKDGSQMADKPAGAGAGAEAKVEAPLVDAATLASMKTELASLKDARAADTARIADLEKAALGRDADAFSAALVKDGKIATDASPAWAALFRADQKQAAALAATLAAGSVLGTNAGKAAVNLPVLDLKDEQMKELAKASLAMLNEGR